ncbi:protein fuzzy [Hermetia illucens]|uniref:protein fuzzy n=1 Tax=Hermetia illucens TaxID=343691 RepID=UPI0018CC09C8|nr:protein fuzzy [Hermetia illucens]
MAIHLMCLTSSGGLPLFTRKKGDCDNLPFSTVASLNGTHMFCKSQGVQLKSTHTDDWILVWKDYENTVTLIAAGKGITEKMLWTLLDLVFNSFLLFVSLEEIQIHKNFDRIKREAKSYMPIVDKLLDYCESELLGYSDCVLANENAQVLTRLTEFSVQFGSLFCAVVVNQKLAAATEGWWDLDVVDRKLLILLMSVSNTSQKDVPVFLPKRSSSVAYRFIAIPLMGTATLCVICGAEPAYHEIAALAQQTFKNDLDILESIDRSMPRNFPESLEIDPNILGVLLINKNYKKYVISRNLQQNSSGKRSMSGSHRLDILRTFYNHAVDIIEEFIADASNGSSGNSDKSAKTNVLESYWCSEYHKCHALSDENDNLICVLYVASVPTYTMRLITQKTLAMIVQEKTVCWQY